MLLTHLISNLQTNVEVITKVKQLQASYRITQRYHMQMIVTLMETNPSDGLWVAENMANT
jgi:hypothetical protein